MEIRQHETNAQAIIVSNPTDEATKLAKQLEKEKFAKFRPNGEIVVSVVYRSKFAKMIAPAASPVTPVDSRSDLIAKIKKYRAENIRLQAYIDTLTGDDLYHPHRTERVETQREIRANLERIENLEKRLTGVPLSTVTDEQLRDSDYALSDKYNDD